MVLKLNFWYLSYGKLPNIIAHCSYKVIKIKILYFKYLFYVSRFLSLSFILFLCLLSLSSPPFFFSDSNTLKKMHRDKWRCGGQWWLRTAIALGCLAFWVAEFCGCFDLEAVVVVLWFWRLILGHGGD